MRWHIKVLRGCNVCANSFIALRAPRRAPRFLPREILTFPRRLSAPLLHHGPPPATPRPMTYHPRDNATAHGPRPTRQRPTAHGRRCPRDNVLPPATPPRDNAPPPATQLPRRSPDNVAGAPEPSSRRPHTPASSPAHPATHLRTRPPPTQPNAVTHDRRSSPRTRHHRSDTPSDAAPHDVTRAPEQSIRAPHSYPTTHQCSDTGRGAKHHRAPSTTGTAWLHHDTTDEQHDTPKPDQSVTKRHGGAYRHYPRSNEQPQLADLSRRFCHFEVVLRASPDFTPKSSSRRSKPPITESQFPLRPTASGLLLTNTPTTSCLRSHPIPST